MTDLENGLDMIAALSTKTSFLASNSDARRELQQNSISLNKEKVTINYLITSKDLINNQFLILQNPLPLVQIMQGLTIKTLPYTLITMMVL